MVLFNGRPLTLGGVARARPRSSRRGSPASRRATRWPTSCSAGSNPGGKLPVSFPQLLGQVPIYYNHEPTGRPCDVTQKYTSRYRDLPTCAPLYQFGYGLSYTTFAVSNLASRQDGRRAARAACRASVDVTNTGKVSGDDVVQLYLHDPVASISQPVRRLRGFERVTLAPAQPGRSRSPSTGRTSASTTTAAGSSSSPARSTCTPGTSSAATLKQSFTVTG